MKKYLILILICLFVTGCTTTSNVKVNDDGTVLEEVTILDNNSKFKSPTLSKEEVIEQSISNYEAALNFKDYNYDIVTKKNKSGAMFYKEFDNICSYFEHTLFNQYIYHHIKCTESDFYYTIENTTEYIPYCSDCSDWPALNNVKLSIDLPVTAFEHNADSVKDNKYTWKFNEETNTDKTFYLKISKESLKNNYERVKIENKEQEKREKINKILILMGIFLVFIGICLVLYKKYEKNKVEY